MGISTKYREFLSREGYDQFFQEVRSAGPNHIDMYVEPIDGGQKKLCKTYMVHPDLDFKLLDFVISQPEYQGRWAMRPIENLQEYRNNTDKRSYRVALRKAQVADYRRFMTKENVFMPFLVFDAKRKLWISGRHRSEAWKIMGENAALFALVMYDLTDEESLYITDITNQWHQESWTEDERALLALEYMLQGQMTEKEALNHVKLDPNDSSSILGAMLYRWHNQSPTDRRLIDVSKAGEGGHGGRPVSLKGLGARVKIFGKDAIEEFPVERWIYLNDPEAKISLGLIRSRTGSTTRGEYAASFNRKEWALKGTPSERWKQFLELVKEVRTVNAMKRSGVSGPSDDRIWMNFVFKYLSIPPAGLVTIKKELTDRELEQSAEVVAKLSLIFGK